MPSTKGRFRSWPESEKTHGWIRIKKAARKDGVENGIVLVAEYGAAEPDLESA